jgi:two-component system nitrogen regulation sensor histidine kinase GlnL
VSGADRDLRRVLDAVLDGIAVVDAQGRVELVNAEACRILETSAQAATGMPLERVAAANPALAQLARSVLASGRPHIECEQRLARRYDGDVLVDVAVSPLIEDDRRRSGVVLALRDRTIQRDLQQQVSERERLSAFGQMAAGIAHEVKNPLGGIRGAAEIVGARADDAKTRDAAELIVREVARIASLVDELMVFTQGDDIHFAAVNIHRVLDDVLDLISMDPLAAGVRIERRFDPSIPELSADAGRLVQVFLNLARNALQVLEGSGTLAIETRMSFDYRLAVDSSESMPTLQVTIADDGPGMSADVLERIATPLFTTRRSGTGLGLAVARHWIARHGGTLRVESAPGEGTRVRVALPLRRADRAAAGRESA